MRILVVGAGSTGGYFGGRLAQAGRDVTFLVRPRRAAQLRETGLVLLSPHGDATLTPTLIETGAPGEPFDAVILAVKAYALDAAIADFAPHCGEETMIVPLLNGMRHLDTLIARFGEHRVLGGVCRVAATLEEAGRIKQLAPFQDLVYGERDGGSTPRLRALDAALQGAGFHAELSAEVMLQMWQKWILLAAGGAATCLFRGTVGQIEAADGAPLVRHILAEAAAITRASGYSPEEKFLATAEKTLTAKGSAFATSMYRDMTAGLPVEGEHIVGDMVARADRLGIDAPLLAAAAVALRVYTGALSAK